MRHVAIAAPSEAAALAADRVVDSGGGAVDAAIAAAVASMVSEPGVVAPGAGAFVTLWPSGGPPVVYDGYMAVPGLAGPHPSPVQHEAVMEYGGGVTTVVGPGSIAVPGAWAAFGLAHDEHGTIPWRDVLRPAIDLAADGVPLGATSASYLRYALGPVFGHDRVGLDALTIEGRARVEGESIVVPGLEATLRRLAAHGADEWYRGDLARVVGEDVRARGGHLATDDLTAYRAIRRTPLVFGLGAWEIATNPPPAVGGAALMAMLRLAGEGEMADLIAAQRRVFGWRRVEADRADDRTRPIADLLESLPGDPIRSPSTAHVSAAEQGGTVCAITLSAGYGSGVIPTGTGMWMNNGFGELELIGDRDRLRPGDRLNSNMAPTVARHADGRTLAIGSPGADRITSALAQTLLALERGAGLEHAVAAPRVHVDVGERVTIAHEPGLALPPTADRVREYDTIHMYFGGVGVAMAHPDGSLTAAADPRRNGVVVTR